MANFLEDNEDLRFYLEKGIDWEPLVRLTEHDFQAEEGFKSTSEAVEFYREILGLVADYSADEIAPRAKAIDEQGLSFKDGDVVISEPLTEVFDGLKGMQLHGMCLPRELGGMNCPVLVYYLNSELIARADVSVMAHHGFHGGIAMAMVMYSVLEGSTTFQSSPPKITSTRFASELSEIASGETWGSMDITEPDAGSDMGALRCQGEVDERGQWRLTGQKILITSGHGRFHLVIARTEKDKPGLFGLSLFLVPIFEWVNGEKMWHATLSNLEEKLGHHGSATVTVNFDGTPAHLIGRRGDGFKLMLLMMNSARIGVGFESLGLCEAAYRLAKAYAAERPSMGKMIARHELIADYLEEMEVEIKAIRAMAIYAAWHEEMAQKIRFRLTLAPPEGEERKQLEKKMKQHQRKARHVTPLLKYRAAEKAVEMARRSIQIHGGGGYTRDYGAEKLLRDAIVFPIYEGTSQIQSLMAMKDNLMAAIKDPQRFVRRTLAAKTLGLTGKTALERRVGRLRSSLYSALQSVMSRLIGGKFKELQNVPISRWIRALGTGWDPKRDFAPALLHAERLTQMLSEVAVADILLEQAMAHPEREALLEAFLERAEPKVAFCHDLITTTGSRILEKLQSESDG